MNSVFQNITVFEIQACSNTGQIIYSSDKISINLYPDDITTPVLETKGAMKTKKSYMSLAVNSTVDKMPKSRPEIVRINSTAPIRLESKSCKFGAFPRTVLPTQKFQNRFSIRKF